MGKIVMSGPQNVSLDGVVQDPDGEEGFKRGGSFVLTSLPVQLSLLCQTLEVR